VIKAIIFDMDGLLVDSEPYWDEARRIMAVEAGATWDWTADDQNTVMGKSTKGWVSFMIERFNLTLSPRSVEEKIIDNMLQLYKERIPFLPGAREAVSMSAMNFSVGLASGSPQNLIEMVVGDRSLQGKFQVTLSGDQFDQGKPAPDIYLAAAAKLGVQPEHCLCLEDSGNGILAGKRAGMKVIAVPDARFYPAAEKLAQADLILESLTHFSLDTIAMLC
jgi:HAD superfamily hydrolase (TIGR01509 family)